LTADEIAEVDKAVLADLEPTWSRPGWRYLKHFNGFATSFWLTPSDITTETVDDLWQPDTEATVVTIRLTTLGGRPLVSAWVRYHSDKRTPKGLPNGLNRLTGRQLAAVRASLPAPTTRALLVVPTRGLLEGDELVLPVAQLQESAVPSPAAQ
jgi:type VII secretion protein EccE